VLPDYQIALQTQTYNTVRELENILVRLETGRLRQSAYAPPSNRNLLEPDLGVQYRPYREPVHQVAFTEGQSFPSPRLEPRSSREAPPLLELRGSGP
jgi:hypothetical protein